MEENKIKFMREVIKLLPMTGKNLTTYSKEIGFSSLKLYEFKNGLFPSEEQYNHFLEVMLNNYRLEMAKIISVLNVSQEDIDNLEENIELYFEKLES